MAWKKPDEAEKRKDEVLGLRDVKPDGEPKPIEERDSVGAAGEVTPVADRTGGLRRTKGATGIDMGAGGDGTDIER